MRAHGPVEKLEKPEKHEFIRIRSFQSFQFFHPLRHAHVRAPDHGDGWNKLSHPVGGWVRSSNLAPGGNRAPRHAGKKFFLMNYSNGIRYSRRDSQKLLHRAVAR